MNKIGRFSAVALTLLISTTLLTVLSQNMAVGAQENEAVVVILSSVGGTTTPAPGQYTYAEGETITLIATPAQGYEFQHWLITGNYLPTHNQPPLIVPDVYLNDPNWVPDFPLPDRTGIDNLVISQSRLDIICGYGYTYTYQPVFAPTTVEPTPGTNEAVVVVLDAVGGGTNPSAGTYRYPEGETITLIATADTGFEFLYWIISGNYLPTHNQPPLIVPDIYLNDPNWVPDFPQPDFTGIDSLVVTQNRLDIICGYGYTYMYQPVFGPIEAQVPMPGEEPETPTQPEQPEEPETIGHGAFGLSVEVVQILLVILVIVVIIAIAFGAYMYTKRR